MIFETRRIKAQTIWPDCLLAAIAGQGRLDLIFGSGLTAVPVVTAPDFAPEGVRTIGGGARIPGLCHAAQPATHLAVDGVQHAINTVAAEVDLFAGLNCAIVLRNGEGAAIVADWLRNHARLHGLQGAVIVDRAGPQEDETFSRRLERALQKSAADGLEALVILSSDVPLGRKGLGPEAHPFNAPDAPGKDRMARPQPDAWAAPFAEPVLFELIRCQFLASARAVLNIEAHDLLRPPIPASVFDLAVASDVGVVPLIGERIYPWSLRKGKRAGFGDHICRRFDSRPANPRWCLAPGKLDPAANWQHIRVGGVTPTHDPIVYDRCMALRHPGRKISKIVPKASLIENEALIARAKRDFGAAPLRAPTVTSGADQTGNRTVIVTTMKNEGPFILEWLAYHRAIGVADFLIYTNDCTDGTDDMLQLLDRHGIVQHRENPFRTSGQKPQHAALAAADDEPLINEANWAVCIDVDEFINIHAGAGRLDDLFAATKGANLISMTWRLFGNSDLHDYVDRPIIEQFTRSAPEVMRKPHQAWGFKTLFRNIGLFKKLGVHRPKGLRPQLVDEIVWLNGSGKPLPKSMYRNAWRSTSATYGYDLVTLNHYAVRSAESFLVKRDRGRVNHVDRDQGSNYWFRMNNNYEENRSIQRMIPIVQAEMDRLLALDGVAAAHAHSVARHRTKISELKARDDYAAFYAELTSARMQTLSRLHYIFGRETYTAGPEVIPDEVVRLDHPKGFFFRPGRTSAQPR